MVAPMLPDLALSPLRAVDEAGMTATAQKWSVVTVRQPGGVYVSTWTWSTGVPARYNTLSLDSPLRADQPASARRSVLSVKTTTPVKAGERWKISGVTNGEAWTREVNVDEVLVPRSKELRRRALVTEIASNP